MTPGTARGSGRRRAAAPDRPHPYRLTLLSYDGELRRSTESGAIDTTGFGAGSWGAPTTIYFDNILLTAPTLQERRSDRPANEPRLYASRERR